MPIAPLSPAKRKHLLFFSKEMQNAKMADFSPIQLNHFVNKKSHMALMTKTLVKNMSDPETCKLFKPGPSWAPDDDDEENPIAKLRKPPEKKLDPEKVTEFVNAVVLQGKIGNLVVLNEEDENPFKVLQRATLHAQICLIAMRNEPAHGYPGHYVYSLKIDGEEYSRGIYPNMQTAKRYLARCAMEKLANTCFFIFKKKNGLTVKSKARELLRDINWMNRPISQGQEASEKILVCENLGTGNGNPRWDAPYIKKVLDHFSKTSRYLMCVLRSNFNITDYLVVSTKALELGLKLVTSEDDPPYKTVVVAKTITRIDVVRELMKTNGEDDLYELRIPDQFMAMWFGVFD